MDWEVADDEAQPANSDVHCQPVSGSKEEIGDANDETAPVDSEACPLMLLTMKTL